MVLNWGLEGLSRLRANGWKFTGTSTVDETREEYKRRSDPVWAYANERLTEDSEGVVFKEDLFNGFKSFCADAGIPLLSRDVFLKKLPEHVTVKTEQRQNKAHRNKDGTPARERAFVGIRFALDGEKGVYPVQGVLDDPEAQATHPTHPFSHLSDDGENKP